MDGLESTGFRRREVLSVTQIVAAIRGALDRRFGDVWVEGEISNLRVAPSGHCYFTLKDRDAQIRAVCFRMQFQSLRFRPREGDRVKARAGVSVYPERGDLQLIVDTIEAAGRGSLQEAFQRLKHTLQAEGLFDQEHKKPIPLLPSRIGVVTSLSGAALQDILRVLKRRNDQIDILIAPVKVQGRGAAAEIAQALGRLNRRGGIDCLILGRGGGSLEDLWAFNEEAVGRAIFHSHIPVISAVGHETDFTIADFVADVRAATPSAAAELVSAARQDLLQRNDDLRVRLRQSMLLSLQRKQGALHKVTSSHAFVSASERVRRWEGDLNQALSRLVSMAAAVVPVRRQGLAPLHRELVIRAKHLGEGKRLALESVAGRLTSCSPMGVLNRGYAIVSSGAGEVIRDPKETRPGQSLNVRVARGAFQVRRES